MYSPQITLSQRRQSFKQTLPCFAVDHLALQYANLELSVGGRETVFSKKNQKVHLERQRGITPSRNVATMIQPAEYSGHPPLPQTATNSSIAAQRIDAIRYDTIRRHLRALYIDRTIDTSSGSSRRLVNQAPTRREFSGVKYLLDWIVLLHKVKSVRQSVVPAIRNAHFVPFRLLQTGVISTEPHNVALKRRLKKGTQGYKEYV